jgi:hypothetical protein
LLQADASYNGYLKHLEHLAAPPPLTNAEEELQLVKQSEVVRNKPVYNMTCYYINKSFWFRFPFVVTLLFVSCLLFVSFQSRSDIGIHTRHSNLPGVNFPISEEALQKLTALRDKQITFVQLVQ